LQFGHLFAKFSRPGDSEVTFAALRRTSHAAAESFCHICF